MSFMEQMEVDVPFGHDIMRAASIRTCGIIKVQGLTIDVMAWFSKGERAGPVFCFIENDGDVDIMWPYKIKEPRLYQSTIKKAHPIIKKTGHSGLVSLKCIISPKDGKPYGLKWTTSARPYILTSMSPLLKNMSVFEWLRYIQQGVSGDWIDKEFKYTYSGRIVDEIGNMNLQLLAFKTMGYELPFNSDENRSAVLSTSIDQREPVHSHRS